MLFLLGAVVMACSVAGLFFVRFWRTTGDRLFLFFGAAFWVLAIHWTLLGLLTPPSESASSWYVPRLLAFLLVIMGIVDKNRRQ